MSIADLYIRNLLESNPLREPLIGKIIERLDLPMASHGLDAGCGIGLQSLLLLQAVGVNGHITGIDILPGLINYGKALVEKAGLFEQITFRESDVSLLPFKDNSFDWVWSMDCVGYPAGEMTPVLQELMRVVKPGGEIILLGWSSQQLLPGYPLLEARLNATCSAYVPFLTCQSPETNFLRALQAFRRAGVVAASAHTFTGDIQGPLTEAHKTALRCLFEMLWGQPQPEVSPEDWREFQRLCRPTSPDFLLNLPDYYGFFTYTMFRGIVPN